MSTKNFAEEYLERLGLESYSADIKFAERKYKDKPLNPYRNEYQRDRDRILYSKAFRNLSHKTQVLPFPHSSFIRTRLTHTIEVSQIARTISRRLRLNEDLTEAIALGHDLGHAPFGHVGEDVLRELLQESGGFEHNEYSLYVVENVEQLPDNPPHPGLNLTDLTRDGILKHTIARDGILKPLHEGATTPYTVRRWRDRRQQFLKKDPLLRPFLLDGDGNWTLLSRTLEGQVVDIADEIAYVTHDVEDARQALRIPGEELISAIPEYIAISGGLNRSVALNKLITGVIEETEKQLQELKGDYRIREKVVIHHPPDLETCVSRVKSFFESQIYEDPELDCRAREAQAYIKKLCKRWSDPDAEIPEDLLESYPRHRALIEEAKTGGQRHVAVCHLVASLTDLEVTDCYEAIFLPTFPTFRSWYNRIRTGPRRLRLRGSKV